jgi:hypothetical protein
MFQQVFMEHDGADARADIAAGGVIASMRAYKGSAFATVWQIDEDGNFHYDGADGGAFDAFPDLDLVRTLDLTINSKTVIHSRFDDYLQTKEQSLIDAGILGGPYDMGDGHHGLVNGAQLQRLHNGAIWQLGVKAYEIEEEIAALREQLESAETRLLAAGA